MDIQDFFTLHAGLPREGPGTDRLTRKAFAMIDGLPVRPAVLDIGCGPGKQTIQLARLSRGRITAIDLHQPFLDALKLRAKRTGQANIRTKLCSMDGLPFAKKSFDLIWGEGSIYCIGFEKGLRYFHRFLKPGGTLAVSEITWLRERVPRPCRAYWNAGYNEMGSVADKARQILDANYEFTGHFVFPAAAWNEYYAPLEQRIRRFERGPLSPGLKETIRLIRQEIKIREKYGDYYSYVFYIMRKP